MDSGSLQLFDKHFEIHGDRFDYSNVRSIGWRAIEGRKFFYFIPLASHCTYQLAIEFLEGPRLDLGAGDVGVSPPFAMGLNKRDFAELTAKIECLFDATRESRLRHYRERMQSAGYFEYDGNIFRPDGAVERKGRRFNLDTKSGAKALSEVAILKCVPGGSIEIDTFWDRDCLHAMLNATYRPQAHS